MLIRTMSGLLLGWLSVSGATAHDPANPNAPTPPTRYSPVLSGAQSYRPVEPLPWGDVNRRVTPPDAQLPAPGQKTPVTKDNGGKRGPHGKH
jgi:hypothetical protein